MKFLSLLRFSTRKHGIDNDKFVTEIAYLLKKNIVNCIRKTLAYKFKIPYIISKSTILMYTLHLLRLSYAFALNYSLILYLALEIVNNNENLENLFPNFQR